MLLSLVCLCAIDTSLGASSRSHLMTDWWSWWYRSRNSRLIKKYFFPTSKHFCSSSTNTDQMQKKVWNDVTLIPIRQHISQIKENYHIFSSSLSNLCAMWIQLQIKKVSNTNFVINSYCGCDNGCLNGLRHTEKFSSLTFFFSSLGLLLIIFRNPGVLVQQLGLGDGLVYMCVSTWHELCICLSLVKKSCRIAWIISQLTGESSHLFDKLVIYNNDSMGASGRDYEPVAVQHKVNLI